MRPIALFAGPCQMESRAHALEMASALKEICGRLGIGLVYKTSFDKANRTSLSGKRGIGLDGALPVFAEIRESLGLPVVTDVHEAEQCARRRASGGRAADPGVPVPPDRPADRGGQNGPRGEGQEGAVPGALGHEERGRQGHGQRQPQRAAHRARRVVRLQHAGGRHARAADHGQDRRTRWSSTPRIPCSSPAGRARHPAATARFVPVLARAAVAVGVAGLFIETHQDPDNAPSDGPNMVPLSQFEALVRDLMAVDAVVKPRARA